MNIYLCLLGPSLISIKIFNHLNDDNLSNKKLIFYYLLFVFINNLISTFISALLFNIKTSIDLNLTNFPILAIKYIIISIIIAIIIPFFTEFLRKNIDYSIEVKTNEKTKNKKNN